MTAKERYDAVVIGAGQAGVPLSTTLARAGWKTVLIEREHVGGTCINEGCTPTKTMVASARMAYLARRAADYGVHTGPVTVDMAKIRHRKRVIVESFRSGSRRRIENTEGLDLLMGEASFTEDGIVVPVVTAEQMREVDRIAVAVAHHLQDGHRLWHPGRGPASNWAGSTMWDWKALWWGWTALAPAPRLRFCIRNLA
jgi:pyruvate/2-oxoglutarate dehydrogenase complex dihydrolipoamide dehydrogenase (E3) component